MSGIPSFSSYTVAGAESRVWRVTPNSLSEAQVKSGEPPLASPKIERQRVEISDAGRALHRTAESLAVGGAAARDGLNLTEAGKIHVPTMTAEERARFESVSDPKNELKARDQVLSRLNPEFSATLYQLEDVYANFVQKFLNENPDFKDASFGFSVNANGKLVATDTDGLDAGKIYRFEKALNASTELVEMSVKVADLNIQIYDAENQNPYFKFDRSNFAQTIDLGAALLSRHAARDAARDGSQSEITQKNWDNNWRQQLARNGERNPPDAERVFYSAR